MRWIMSVLSTWVVLMVIAGYFGDYFYIRDAGVALLAALILSLVNTVVRPILVFLTLPITILTMGLFLLVINALTLLLTSFLVDGFDISGFWAAFFMGILISILNYLIHALILNRLK
ncbi:putative membrane protein [Caldalkalibacillus uzonensis]|uniref:Membrane protein n=1 Tax=Caldalkalibacillus uzonensis TaxID=353224 RepID=A0ABU0CXR4_9BACI|nr:phage holin family protein [Caldalkalibacillus uzonensis]MDQ0340862.1 putative membrane protein [Caldalkalibacillus uzonensis]